MYIIAFALTALVAGGIWIAKSNYDGICLWTGKQLTDRQKLELAFEHLRKQGLTASGQFPVKPGTDEPVQMGQNSMVMHEVRGYGSFDEYIALYPDCCKIKWLGREKAYSWPEPTFWQRIGGNYGFGVEITSRQRFKRPNGTHYVKRTVLHPYFANCGALSPDFDHDG
jgi:hypothetical protein